MTTTASNQATVFSTRAQVTAALQRAAHKAKQIAEQTGTQLVVGMPATKSDNIRLPTTDSKRE